VNGFQIIGVSVAAAFGLMALAGLLKRRISLPSGLFWLTVWTAAALAILNPEWTRVVAQALGIARGADLVFYCAILAMFVGFFLVYAKLRRLDHRLTTIVREMAIDEAATTTLPRRADERTTETD
jgi:hypothetical protein